MTDRLIVISGRSGSGKSAALNALEDFGDVCIDNLPATLLPELMQRLKESPDKFGRTLAVGIDVRNPWSDLHNIEGILEELRSTGVDYRVIYLAAGTDTLIRRFRESRRKHPLTSDHLDLHHALVLEDELLQPMQRIAEEVIDTSQMSPHDLGGLLRKRFHPDRAGNLQLVFESFGFKYGIPSDADMVFDVRCLPNPHWEPHLRPLTGRDEAVATFLENSPAVAEMQASIADFVDRWLPSFIETNRSYLTIAVGCTGGQHRSVYLCENLHRLFASRHDNVQVHHRELAP